MTNRHVRKVAEIAPDRLLIVFSPEVTKYLGLLEELAKDSRYWCHHDVIMRKLHELAAGKPRPLKTALNDIVCITEALTKHARQAMFQEGDLGTTGGEIEVGIFALRGALMAKDGFTLQRAPHKYP